MLCRIDKKESHPLICLSNIHDNPRGMCHLQLSVYVQYARACALVCACVADILSLDDRQTYPRGQNHLVRKLGLGGLGRRNTITGAVRTNQIVRAGFIR